MSVEIRGKMMELWREDVPFAQGNLEEDKPVLESYCLNDGKRHAAVIVCPGGGYMRRAEHEGKPIAEWLNACGISAFVLHYRVSPYQYPVPLIDAQRAIRYVRYHADEWDIDPERIGILGFSAGGHLAAAAGTHYDQGDEAAADPIDQVTSRPDAMILCYPVITFNGPHCHQGSRLAQLGEQPDPSLQDLLSNELQVTADTPPSFIWHTADDEAVHAENSLMFAASLSRHQVPYELHIYEKGRHGLGLALDHPHVAAWTKACESWLTERGFRQ